MSGLRFGAVAALLVLVAVGGLVALAPTLHGQQVQVFRGGDGGDERRIVEIVAGPGQEIGVTVRDVDQADAKREQLTGPGSGHKLQRPGNHPFAQDDHDGDESQDS